MRILFSLQAFPEVCPGPTDNLNLNSQTLQVNYFEADEDDARVKRTVPYQHLSQQICEGQFETGPSIHPQ